MNFKDISHCDPQLPRHNERRDIGTLFTTAGQGIRGQGGEKGAFGHGEEVMEPVTATVKRINIQIIGK